MTSLHTGLLFQLIHDFSINFLGYTNARENSIAGFNTKFAGGQIDLDYTNRHMIAINVASMSPSLGCSFLIVPMIDKTLWAASINSSWPLLLTPSKVSRVTAYPPDCPAPPITKNQQPPEKTQRKAPVTY